MIPVDDFVQSIDVTRGQISPAQAIPERGGGQYWIGPAVAGQVDTANEDALLAEWWRPRSSGRRSKRHLAAGANRPCQVQGGSRHDNAV